MIGSVPPKRSEIAAVENVLSAVFLGHPTSVSPVVASSAYCERLTPAVTEMDARIRSRPRRQAMRRPRGQGRTYDRTDRQVPVRTHARAVGGEIEDAAMVDVSRNRRYLYDISGIHDTSSSPSPEGWVQRWERSRQRSPSRRAIRRPALSRSGGGHRPARCRGSLQRCSARRRPACDLRRGLVHVAAQGRLLPLALMVRLPPPGVGTVVAELGQSVDEVGSGSLRLRYRANSEGTEYGKYASKQEPAGPGVRASPSDTLEEWAWYQTLGRITDPKSRGSSGSSGFATIRMASEPSLPATPEDWGRRPESAPGPAPAPTCPAPSRRDQVRAGPGRTTGMPAQTVTPGPGCRRPRIGRPRSVSDQASGPSSLSVSGPLRSAGAASLAELTCRRPSGARYGGSFPSRSASPRTRADSSASCLARASAASDLGTQLRGNGALVGCLSLVAVSEGSAASRPVSRCNRRGCRPPSGRFGSLPRLWVRSSVPWSSGEAVEPGAKSLELLIGLPFTRTRDLTIRTPFRGDIPTGCGNGTAARCRRGRGLRTTVAT